MQFQYQRFRSDKISKEKILQELEEVAKKNEYIEFSYKEFNKLANISSGTVKNNFGSWQNAMNELKTILSNKGISLKPRKSRSHLTTFSDKDLFDEMEKIWTRLGHRPSKYEWDKNNPKYTSGMYRYRFNGWANACLKFIEHKMGGRVEIETPKETHPHKNIRIVKKEEPITYGSRNISAGLKVKVLEHDGFKCCFCGRSPATDIGIKLHIDHKIPFSKGGLTTLDNLQTLCQECNLGKSDKKIRLTESRL